METEASGRGKGRTRQEQESQRRRGGEKSRKARELQASRYTFDETATECWKRVVVISGERDSNLRKIELGRIRKRKTEVEK
jgi:phage terminase small subunit